MDKFYCEGNVMFEPRLLQYITKVNEYKKLGTKVPPYIKVQYGITEEDIKKINAFMKGDRKIYNHENRDKYTSKKPQKKILFPSDELKPEDDPRLQLLKKKVERDKEALKKRYDYSEYDNNIGFLDNGRTFEQVNNFYDNGNNKPKESDWDKNFKETIPKNLKKPKPSTVSNKLDNNAFNSSNTLDNFYRLNNTGDEDQPLFQDSHKDSYKSKYLEAYKPNSALIYNNPPKISYHNALHYGNNNDLPHGKINPNLFNDLTNYDCNVNKVFNYQHSMYDSNSEQDFSCKHKSNYENLFEKEKVDDYGVIDTKKKSFGYRNPSELYFDYINNDMQNPDHVVMATPRGGIMTRNDNRTVARKYVTRETFN